MREFYTMVVQTFGRLGPAGSIAIAAALTILATAGGFFTVVKLPADHFLPCVPHANMQPVLRFLLLVLRNVLGSVMIVMGFIMVLPLVPGPGLVFILLGLSLLTFPGKRAMELRLLRVNRVNQAINSLRARFGKPPFHLP